MVVVWVVAGFQFNIEVELVVGFKRWVLLVVTRLALVMDFSGGFFNVCLVGFGGGWVGFSGGFW